ncbi:MAG: cytochrome P450 [Caldilineaceae bacterium]|nr:cytochrome P450 [Caldilineaceae bacterium]
MSHAALAPAHPKRLPGPQIPGWSRWITNLLPWRVDFDSLSYMLQGARQFGNFYAIWVGQQPIYVVSDPKLAHTILVERAKEFHKAELVRAAVGPFAAQGLFLNEGDDWRRQRKLAQPAFHHQRIEAYGTTMVAQTLDLLASWQPGATLDIAHEMTKLTLGIVNKTLFNVDVRAQADHIGDLMTTILAGANDRVNNYNPLWGRLFQHNQRREAAAIQELFTIIDQIIADHRHHGTDTGDLLSMLLAARDEEGQPMPEQRLRDEVITLFVAGHETTANALAWAFYLVAEHSDVEAQLRQEVAALQGKAPTLRDLAQLPYSEQVIKEAMRLYPPAGGVTRQPLHDVELNGYTIPKGSTVAISTYVMHRDPALYPDPERFDPERFTPANEAALPKSAYLPFGGGPRICIGNSFAMLEARLILLTVLQRFHLQLKPGYQVRAQQLFTLRPKGGLPMQVQTR